MAEPAEREDVDTGAYGGTGVYGNWVVPPARKCDGCRVEAFLLIRVVFGPETGRRLCGRCAPPAQRGAEA